ncbi:laccase domain-containing protein [Novimethylophilus kurashikiensis]|uniref:Purine nucleoside phosphorylase n=1 Tax=Novimethylophilus kurashikiensis TaxID=1825523 RepID=A0A2R5F2X4_9PROT|nr:peptidoglycan editing factor PgeF [Novimethylophilus kurashikiensis]GBG12902.1 laccase domain-containing protein [Novimethylophilus kurashikiensis]
MKNNFIVPEWPAPANVHALQTTRLGGLSRPPYDSLNLGSHVGDEPLIVERNRNLLNPYMPSEPVWLEQVHGTHVVLAETAGCLPKGDACVARADNAVCAIMTADCLPVLLCAEDGSVVGAAHAGWRGLADGVIEQTVDAMQVGGNRLLAWLGPAIGPDSFEVGEDVRAAFIEHNPAAGQAFKPDPTTPGKFLADLYVLARQRLDAVGVARIYGGEYCTYSDSQRFYSYRRDGRTGRMASLIWKA